MNKEELYYEPNSKTLREEPQVLTRWHDPIIEKLQQENKQLKEQINEYQKAVDETTSEKIDLQDENKQLKEELEKKNKKYWQQQCAYYSSILYSLEEWLKETRINSAFTDELTLMEVQLKIQELRNKYEK